MLRSLVGSRVTASGLHKSSSLNVISKITNFRSRERSAHFCMSEGASIDRPHRYGAIRISTAWHECEFAILHGCYRQKGSPYSALYNHVKKMTTIQLNFPAYPVMPRTACSKFLKKNSWCWACAVKISMVVLIFLVILGMVCSQLQRIRYH